ncbi:DHH family phosphoesterase [Sinanaerobacter chloroacetimidivorans]|uniref:Bifunctional oligoribonuclease/PAP phosphatase NrnA n=1 Tax=Sinanaerobacter chloroacetimidivorans TaxID=2818044 RepID=A0A8J7VXC0_9FIRM|nr:bifunctional oligoribonuclease/PAP phosphatase NrnA [Sinanaerobacter chloroacetimidivorans]MBR0596757.1 bifunctional oligoribonuclease/PAP phosphatase NrnA [Sinanaerobacter chloroacetimidivorans]
MSNNTLKEIAVKLMDAKTVLLYPHILMDGDTLGSSVALCRALRKAGKTSYILIEDGIPAYLSFLDQGYCTNNENMIEDPDISISVDCSDIDRFTERKEKFLEGKLRICVDHHTTNNYFADLNYIDEHASATGEIVYDLINEMEVEIDVEIAEALYTAITTDTGNFQYTNTTKKTHLITAELFDIGIDLEKVSVELYQNIRHEKLKITKEVLNTIEMIGGGKADIAYVTQEMLAKTGASMDETEGIIETLRNISGVEIAAFLKENDGNHIKVGLRSKTYADVSSIAQSFGGGGHIKAAGCTLYTTLEDAKRQISDAIVSYLETVKIEEMKEQAET